VVESTAIEVSVGSMVVAVGSTVVAVGSSIVLLATGEPDDVEEAPLIDLSELHEASANSATPATSAQRREAELTNVEMCM